MARIDGATNYQLNFNITTPGPIDSRMRVEHEDDLTKSSTWPTTDAPVFKGMAVSVMDTGEIWVLKDPNMYTDKTSGNGWVKVGGSDYIAGEGIKISGNTISVDIQVTAQEVFNFLNGNNNN